ncbi:hypothetical protein [Teredinibacter franksiae]|jgi:hypothetical protein|uniref:hypothetical protein n=1 Tax=Teredinibacter franksiae TaxID=2761453 RepID=UPI001625DBD0|nr:hypothetical protein [Teredinibacter franksiae]
MRIFTKLALIIASLLALTACGAEYAHTGSHYHQVDHQEVEYVVVEEVVTVIDVPELESFDMVDSYGNSSEFTPNKALAVSPYVDNGWFEVYWQADSWDDYWVEYYINNSPSLEAAAYVGSQQCGMGLECEEDGLQFCQYTSDFQLWCDTGEDQVTDISEMVHAIPQTFYFILQVCDLWYEYCEYSYYPVLFE